MAKIHHLRPKPAAAPRSRQRAYATCCVCSPAEPPRVLPGRFRICARFVKSDLEGTVRSGSDRYLSGTRPRIPVRYYRSADSHQGRTTPNPPHGRRSFRPAQSAPQSRNWGWYKVKIDQKPSVRLELDELRRRLQEAEETLNAIRGGEVDALVVSGPSGEKVFTLEGAEYPYRVLVESMNEGAISLSNEGVILYCNSAFAQMVGVPLDQTHGPRA